MKYFVLSRYLDSTILLGKESKVETLTLSLVYANSNVTELFVLAESFMLKDERSFISLK